MAVFFINFIKANQTNFQAICIGKRAQDDITSFNIDSAEMKCEDNVTLLGINIDFMLRFDDHVSQICKRASKQLAVLKRIGRFLTKQGTMTIYNSFIVSNFNYCPLAWHFCSSSSTNKLEKKIKRGLYVSSTMIHVIPTSSVDLDEYRPLTCKEDDANGFRGLQNR